ncbi:hypothetical protein ACN20G_31420 (plasmid) [Streptomyces sp. BI20]|uniref:hypothetical protein n=1 Tax=Streptomyces sp. BI20 TaxID=3403460 RepID=UPI003C708A14
MSSSDQPTAAPAPEVVPVTDGRAPLGAAVALLASVVGLVSGGVGALLAVVNLAGYAFGPWTTDHRLGTALVGAAMLGTAPGLLAAARARTWAEARTLVLPVVVVVPGLLVVTLVNPDAMPLLTGGPIVTVFFALGWIAVLGGLSLWIVLAVPAQWLRARSLERGGRRSGAPSVAPLPAWSRPALALLGSSWTGIGAGLVFLPGFWGAFVPWATTRVEAQALGVWALALGVGVLAALAEDDVRLLRPAGLALPGVAAAVGLALVVRAGEVAWGSGAGLALVAMLIGLAVAGAAGRLLATRHPAGAPTARPGPGAA